MLTDFGYVMWILSFFWLLGNAVQNCVETYYQMDSDWGRILYIFISLMGAAFHFALSLIALMYMVDNPAK